MTSYVTVTMATNGLYTIVLHGMTDLTDEQDGSGENTYTHHVAMYRMNCLPDTVDFTMSMG